MEYINKRNRNLYRGNMGLISYVIIGMVLFCGLIILLVDEIKYKKNIDPILRDMIKDAKRR